MSDSHKWDDRKQPDILLIHRPLQLLLLDKISNR